MTAKAAFFLCLTLLALCFIGGSTFLWIDATCGGASQKAQNAAAFTFIFPGFCALIGALITSICEWG